MYHCSCMTIQKFTIYLCREQKLLLHCRLEPVSESSESGALSLSSAARHIDFHSLRRIYVVLVAHSIALSLHYLLLYGGNVRIAGLVTTFSFSSLRLNSRERQM